MSSLVAETGTLASIIEQIDNATSIAVCGHTRPDGDSVGSVLALCLALQALGKRPQPVLADNAAPPKLYAFLDGFKGFMQPNELAGEIFDLFIVVDTPVVSRLNEAQSLFREAKKAAVVDHHPLAGVYGDAFFTRPSAAAVGEIIWELIGMLGAKQTAEIAQCCYTALVTDTGRFQFQNTTAVVLRAAADMVEAGAYPAEIASAVYQSRTYSSLALRALVTDRLTITNHGLTAYSWLTQHDLQQIGANLDDYEGMADLVRSVGGIEVAVMLKAEEPATTQTKKAFTIRGNLRSKGAFDVGEVARHFGGGGHAAAAGFTVEDMSIDELLIRLLPLLPGYDE